MGHQIAPTAVKPDLRVGTGLAFSTVEQGLREMNPQISFDAAVRRPSDYTYVLQGGDNMTEVRTGVYYNGIYVCAIDRDQIPEFKLWEEVDGLTPIPLSDAEKNPDGTRVSFVKVKPGGTGYIEALFKAQKHDDNFRLMDDGTVMIYEAFREGKVLGKVISVGWRHTFERLISRGIPGVTRQSIAAKFRVDMSLKPLGTPDEIERLLYEE